MTNSENFDEERLITELMITIDKEVVKPIEEQDSDLIDECMEFLDEIDGDRYKPDETEKQRRLDELSELIAQKTKRSNR